RPKIYYHQSLRPLVQWPFSLTWQTCGRKNPYGSSNRRKADVANSEKSAEFLLCVEQDAEPSRPTHVWAGGFQVDLEICGPTVRLSYLRNLPRGWKVQVRAFIESEHRSYYEWPVRP